MSGSRHHLIRTEPSPGHGMCGVWRGEGARPAFCEEPPTVAHVTRWEGRADCEYRFHRCEEHRWDRAVGAPGTEAG